MIYVPNKNKWLLIFQTHPWYYVSMSIIIVRYIWAHTESNNRVMDVLHPMTEVTHEFLPSEPGIEKIINSIKYHNVLKSTI